MTGIDKNITKLLTDFNSKLWANVSNKSFYGKAYRNLKGKDIIPEVEINGEYKEVMFDDSKNAICFFDPGNKIENAGVSRQMKQPVRIVFAVKVTSVYPTFDTEQVIADVYKILYLHALRIEINTIETGIKAYGDLSTTKLKNYYMHPWWSFAFNTTILTSY